MAHTSGASQPSRPRQPSITTSCHATVLLSLVWDDELQPMLQHGSAFLRLTPPQPAELVRTTDRCVVLPLLHDAC